MKTALNQVEHFWTDTILSSTSLLWKARFASKMFYTLTFYSIFLLCSLFFYGLMRFRLSRTSKDKLLPVKSDHCNAITWLLYNEVCMFYMLYIYFNGRYTCISKMLFAHWNVVAFSRRTDWVWQTNSPNQSYHHSRTFLVFNVIFSPFFLM